ncbi:AAA family ATPase [Actinophytocola sp.]|uniref:NACHT and WD repeat domain-containing protein n=1 Tax=Actinophytocola sp. TaxID=1872138 RepID=UPI002DDC9727|nr:AAA family ATPase [Actinophytocola sp.]
MQQEAERPLALFLLDLCSAGTAARLPWQGRLEGRVRGWVIAACQADRPAYDGRFTEAVIEVLSALRRGELDVDPSLKYVPVPTVARAIRREVNRLASIADAYDQQVTASLVDISVDEELPFFPNPAYTDHPRPRLRAAVDPGTLPFLDDLDEGLDARHFLERATGLGRLTDANSPLVGCFTGRDRELREISPWLNGLGNSPLCVVTGSPGSGKSALLGVLVCAAHPLLRGETEAVWKRIAQWPLPIDNLAAVHARQRGLGAVTASIVRQLGLPENLTAADLVQTLSRGKVSPVIVLDALDEADDPTEIMTDLLLPLFETAAVRLLIGVRHYQQFKALFDRAWMVDLDTVEQDVLEDDLYRYVNSLLRATVYRRQGAVIGAFAHSVASILAAPDEDGSRTWGPFLVAGLYTRHLVRAHVDPPVSDPARAAGLGEAVPVDLPGVLELDLALQDDEQPWLRPVMSALAYARGAGMPVSVLTRVAPVFARHSAKPTVAEIRSALSAGKFYLRQAMDTDHSNVYRLFHQGLADTLAQHPFHHAGQFLDALLSSLGPPDNRDWDAAEPYLLRHVADHAADADRLKELESDPGLLLNPNFSLATDSPAGAALAAKARRFVGITTPAKLALAAVRAGLPELARRAANLAGRPPLTWQPRWILGEPSPATYPVTQPTAQEPDRSVKEVARVPVPAGPPIDDPDRTSAVAISADGRHAVAVGRHHALVLSQSDSGSVHSDLFNFGGNVVVISDDGRRVLVGGPDGLQTLSGPRWVIRESAPFAGNVVAVAVAITGDVGLVNADGVIMQWHPDRDDQFVKETRHRNGLWSVVFGAAGVIACYADAKRELVVFSSGETERYNLGSPAYAVTMTPGGRYVIAATSRGTMLITDRERIHLPVALGHPVPIRALATSPDGHFMAAGREDGSVEIWRIWPELFVTRLDLSKAPIRAVAVARHAKQVVAADVDGVVYLGDPTAEPSDPRPPIDVAPQVPLVTAFTAVDARTAVVGWQNGSVQVFNPREPVLCLDQSHIVGNSRVRHIAATVIAGEPAVLVSTQDSHWLLTSTGWSDVSRWSLAGSLAPRPKTSGHIVIEGRLMVVAVTGTGGMRIANAGLGGDDVRDVGDHPGCQVVECAHVNGRPMAFTGGTDGAIRVWDLLDEGLTDTIEVGRPVWRIEVVDGHLLLVGAGGELIAFEHVSVVRR